MIPSLYFWFMCSILLSLDIWCDPRCYYNQSFLTQHAVLQFYDHLLSIYLTAGLSQPDDNYNDRNEIFNFRFLILPIFGSYLDNQHIKCVHAFSYS